MKRIEIIVQPDGQTQVETKGFAGPACRQAIEFIEKVLGQRTSEQLTAEFHQATSTETSQQQQQE